MKTSAIGFVVLLLQLVGGSQALAGSILHGQVYLIGENDEVVPAPNVTVRLEGRGDPTTTLSEGDFQLLLPVVNRNGREVSLFQPGEKATLVVQKKDWVIHSPAEGEVRIPDDLEKEVIKIRLLPKGSHKLWSQERFQKFIQDLQEKAKAQVKPQGKPEDVDFGLYLKEWATRLGFSAQEAREQVEKWVAETEHARDPFDRALAEYYKKNFKEARKLFLESAEVSLQKLKDLQEKTLQISREAAVRLLRAGDAAYSDYDFAGALSEYRRASDLVGKDQSPQLWAEVQNGMGKADYEIGVRTEGSKLHEYLAQAVAALRAALEVRTREQLPQQWAATQNNAGIALRDQAIRTSGEEGRQLLAQAVTAYRAALEVRTREQLPQQWAATQDNLGTALRDQASRTSGEEGRQLLAQAVTAYRASLEVRTRERLPQQWAMTQNNLGVALRDQADRTRGEERERLLVQSVAAQDAAWEILGQDAPPGSKRPGQLIDLNSATEKDLMTLPGIDESSAVRIIQGRPYKIKTELKSRRIIPVALYDKIIERITVEQGNRN